MRVAATSRRLAKRSSSLRISKTRSRSVHQPARFSVEKMQKKRTAPFAGRTHERKHDGKEIENSLSVAKDLNSNQRKPPVTQITGGTQAGGFCLDQEFSCKRSQDVLQSRGHRDGLSWAHHFLSCVRSGLDLRHALCSTQFPQLKGPWFQTGHSLPSVANVNT